MSIKSVAIIIRDETTTHANSATRVGGILVEIADDLIAKQSEIDLNTAKVGYTEALVSSNTDVTANTAKNTYPNADATKLAGIEVGANVNTINSSTVAEPSGSDVVLNVISLTQAEYDASTPIATTFYIING